MVRCLCPICSACFTRFPGTLDFRFYSIFDQIIIEIFLWNMSCYKKNLLQQEISPWG